MGTKTVRLSGGEYTVRVEYEPPGTIPGTVIVYLRNVTLDTEAMVPLITAVKERDVYPPAKESAVIHMEG